MGIWRRASLYLTGNKKKMIILLAILTILTVLVFLCISVGSAAGLSVQKLKSQMGGYFKIAPDFAQGKFGEVGDALVKKAVDAGGMKAVNGMDIQYFMVEDLALLSGRFTEKGDEKAKLARFLGNTDSSRSEYFMLKYYSLVDGRHIAPDDNGKAVISDALAEKNHLSVGDVFTVRVQEENLPEERKETVTSHALEVAGVFHIDSAQSYVGGNVAECDMEENFIFTDTSFIREVSGEAAGIKIERYTNGAAFFVEDSGELEEIMGNILKWEDYDWEDYTIVKNNKTYEDLASPLEKLSGLVLLMVSVIAVVSAVMLSLILFLWMRDRIHEIGIYLSIGIRKTQIIRQYVLENLLVAAAASGVTEEVIEKSLFAEGEAETFGDYAAETLELEICIGAAEAAKAAGVGIVIVFLSTGMSSIPVLRLHPKEILSKIS